jgi:AraC-like DNA-binding protein
MLERTLFLCDSTNMYTDPFSDILKLTQAQSLLTGGFSAGGAWAMRFPAPDKIKFFAVVHGSCWVRLEGHDQPVRFGTGDVGLLSAPRWSILSSDLETEPVDAMDIFARAGRSVAQLGDGTDFAHIGGHVLLDPVSGPLLREVLPPWIHIRASSPQAAVFGWLLDQLVAERSALQPGMQLASAQLSQLLFIQILRAHLATSGPLDAGWLRALSDARIAPALRLMHDDPARSWHLDDLAKACAMSRTTFAYHFKILAGVAPLTYLTNWRMRLAERALSDDVSSVSVVARTLGYASDSAFSHAFKRVTGRSPKAYRAALRLMSQSVPVGAPDRHRGVKVDDKV